MALQALLTGAGALLAIAVTAVLLYTVQPPAAAGGITLLVSHRLSNIQNADLVLVLAGGTVAEAGNHDELVRRDGIYAELHGLQAAAYRL